MNAGALSGSTFGCQLDRPGDPLVAGRGDRIDVTQSEANDVATRLRLLAEQVNDRASGLPDADTAEAHLAIAEALGEMSQALR